jgi:hypothetical protein
LAILVLALAPLIPLWKAFIPGQAIGPFDQIRQMAPWNGPAPSQPWDVLQADGALQFYPWRDMVFESWGKGQLPAWNPYELAGTPLLANSQSGVFYPPHILLGILHIPTPWAITLLAWFHLAWAALGVYVLARRLGGSRMGSVIAGLSFGLSSFMIAWTALASVITTVAWIPWILASIVAIFHRPFRNFIALAASVAMMLLAGHLQFAAYGLMAAVAMTIGMFFAGPRGTTTVIALGHKGGPSAPIRESTIPTNRISLGQAVIALAVGGLIASIQLLPVLSFGKFSHRQNTASAEGYAGYVSSAIKPFELANLSIPTALGSPREPLQVGQTTISEYWPSLVKQGDNFAESALCIGPLILAGLFAAPWKRRELWPFAAIAVLALLLALGTPLNAALYYGVPGWSATGSPGRVICLFVMAACVIGGIGLGELAQAKRPIQIAAFAAILIGIVLAYLGSSLAPSGSVPADALDTIKGVATATMLPTLAISTVLAAIAIALLSNPTTAKYRSLAIAVPVALCWIGYGSNYVMTGAPLDPIQGISPQARVAFINDDWELAGAAHAIAPPDTASLSRIHELGGYDSLIHRDTNALLKDINGKDPAPEANGNMMFVKPGADPAKLTQAGVTELWSSKDPAPQPLPGPGRCTVSDGQCQITSETYNSIDLTATGSGQLTLRDRMMPGWTAEVDGKPVTLQDGLWRALDLGPPGDHKVSMHYSPPGFHTGLALTLLGLAAILCVWLAGRRPKGIVK